MTTIQQIVPATGWRALMVYVRADKREPDYEVAEWPLACFAICDDEFGNISGRQMRVEGMLVSDGCYIELPNEHIARRGNGLFITYLPPGASRDAWQSNIERAVRDLRRMVRGRARRDMYREAMDAVGVVGLTLNEAIKSIEARDYDAAHNFLVFLQQGHRVPAAIRAVEIAATTSQINN